MDSQAAPSDSPTGQAPSSSFMEQAEANPCLGCSAPCCRLVLLPHPTPATFMQLDYIRYILGYSGIEMILDNEGRWQVLIQQTCRLFDPVTQLCTVHDSPRKPKTCTFFNPHQCYYRAHFSGDDTPNLIRLDMEAFEALLPHIRLDADGNIVEIPAWDTMRALVRRGPAELRETKA